MTADLTIREQALTEATLERLKTFEALVAKWSPKINLVAKSTLGDIWDRHIVDSVQLYDFLPAGVQRVADFGSGGGFPGIVMAILSAQYEPQAQHVLVESDQRKATFLREAVRQCGLTAEVLSARIEAVPALQADVVTARALAALPQLFELLQPHMRADATAILPKGAAHQSEVDAALEKWQFDLAVHPSRTEQLARILCVTSLSRRA